MGTKMVILTLFLLVPGTVSAEAEDGNEAEPAESCPPVELTTNPTSVGVNPECVDIGYAEESK